MPNQPLVSIIIPTFNRAHLLGETLDSILAQTYPNWECIVVDDGSTDGTEALLKAYIAKDSRFQYHKRPDSHLAGGNGARNYGFEVSNGGYVQWFDDDDEMLPEFLDTKVKFFNSDIDLVICSGDIVDYQLRNKTPINLVIDTYLFRDYVLWKLKIFTPSVLFKKSFLNNYDLFLEHLKRGQETEFFSRIFFNLNPNRYVIINDSFFLYRQHQESKTFVLKGYQQDLVEAHVYVSIENLKRSVILKDKKLGKWLYKSILHFFFRCLENNDIKNAKYIYRNLYYFLLNKNWKLALQFKTAAFIFLIIGRGSYRFEKYFKNCIPKF
ncbi:glycosyltransferase family 2 protein [Bizionia sp.]|uniref:glycosyltransferase family 2 protein n=1 Tax=Bizionia sp. TaxID=1954480 RepID=UPI003A9530F3